MASLLAGIVVLSCSSPGGGTNDDDNYGNRLSSSSFIPSSSSVTISSSSVAITTYWYSAYIIASTPYGYVTDLFRQNENPSYDDIKYVWSEVRRLGTFIESYDGVSEQEMKDFLIERDVSPKDADGVLDRLKERGNAIASFNTDDPSNFIIIYVEPE
ncbi:MAG: hypothetical protein FWH22_08585 [Fibromonadales bacterium]|nr:hypothetical protein [Fibromonadales bacterium]